MTSNGDWYVVGVVWMKAIRGSVVQGLRTKGVCVHMFVPCIFEGIYFSRGHSTASAGAGERFVVLELLWILSCIRSLAKKKRKSFHTGSNSTKSGRVGLVLKTSEQLAKEEISFHGDSVNLRTALQHPAFLPDNSLF